MKTFTAIETVTLDLGLFGEQDVDVHYSYSPGRAGCQYLPNGDPGYPDEPDLLEIRGVCLAQASTIQVLPREWWDNKVCLDTIIDIISSRQED